MKSVQLLSLLLCALCINHAFGQTVQNEIAVINGTTVSSSPNLKFENGSFTMVSTLDNYLKFQNPTGGIGLMQYDQNGHFVWGIPGQGMRLTPTGQLKIGPWPSLGGEYGQSYKLQVDGGGYFSGQLKTERYLTNSNVTEQETNGSKNFYQLSGNITNYSYHAGQYNVFQAGGGTMVGYQSAAQQNVSVMSGANYTDAGPGQIWSVQSNGFLLTGSSHLSKFVNSYIKTTLTTGSSIGSYYMLYLAKEASGDGQATVSQLGNYYGLYQESEDAKNYFAGKVCIGNPGPNQYDLIKEALTVNGNIVARKLKITQNVWADFVFEDTYKLPNLKDVESFIKEHKHLPEVISAKEVEEKGIDVGESQAMLLKKIEELTLYLIDMQKQLEDQKKRIEDLKIELANKKN
jgi:hypothetical protein